MNQYGAMAQAHWKRFLPTRYSEIEDPEEFFSALGREVADQIGDLARELAGDDPPGEGYLGKVGRLNAARMQAREMVLTERILLPAEPGSPMDEAEEPEDHPGDWTTDWIPEVEDPDHPWWREQREQSSTDS